MTTDSKEQLSAQAHEQLWELIKDIRFAMFTVRDGSGHLTSRPMTTQNTASDEDSSLWFFMSRTSATVADLAGDPAVNVAYADPKKDSYVSVSGNARVSDDTAKKHKLWTKLTQAWFPAGPTDPDLALVQVKISHAEYWDVDCNQAVQLFKMAKAVVTGKPPDMGKHGEVHMA
jgi:general stress protein 26